jgi:uncharacterized protein (TIGR03790 family)
MSRHRSSRALARWLSGLAAGLLVLAATGPVGLGAAGTQAPPILLPKQHLGPDDLAVIVNDADPFSVRIGKYYAARRSIPDDHIIHISLAPGRPRIEPAELAPLYARVQSATPANVQAYVLTWAEPYQVGCMSLTTAFAAGYDASYCAQGCEHTRLSPYFASDSSRPYSDFGLRPTMALAGLDFERVKQLIDRGIAADGTRPKGTAYLMETSDKTRSVRAAGFGQVRERFGERLKIEEVHADYLTGKSDVLFYFTGAVSVPGIATNGFLPGAVADHLTSTGGQLTDSRQMSSLRWLEAGATGSYGTVTEPCNFLGKFPDPAILMQAYISGATLIEAYWKSVLMPGQGIFIGEPLARPFGGHQMQPDAEGWVFSTYALRDGAYQLEQAADPMGPYRAIRRLAKQGLGELRFRLPSPVSGYYRLTEIIAD